VQANRVLLRSLSSDDTATLQPELMATASATPSNRGKVDGDAVVQRFMQIYLVSSHPVTLIALDEVMRKFGGISADWMS